MGKKRGSFDVNLSVACVCGECNLCDFFFKHRPSTWLFRQGRARDDLPVAT